MHSSHVLTGKQSFIRNVNRAVLIRAIRNDPGISRANLAKLTGLNKSTVGNLIDGLCEDGWISRKQVVSSNNVGRRPVPFVLDRTRRVVLGATIDSERSLLIAKTISGEVCELSVTNLDSKDADKAMDILAHQVAEMSRKFARSQRKICGLGVATPGPVRAESGVLLVSDSLGWKELPVRDMLRMRLENLGVETFPLMIERGLGCIALHRAELSDLPDDETLLYVHAGDGIGAAFVVRNELMSGHQGLSGVIGHFQVIADGPMCNCGRTHCAKMIVTLNAIKHRLGLSATEIKAKAQERDCLTISVLQEAGRELGTLIYNLCQTFAPHHLYVGGPAFQLSQDYVQAAQERLDELNALSGVPGQRIQSMRFDKQTAAHGAADAMLRYLLSLPASAQRNACP